MSAATGILVGNCLGNNNLCQATLYTRLSMCGVTLFALLMGGIFTQSLEHIWAMCSLMIHMY